MHIMSVMPASRREWFKLILLPFQSYVLLALIGVYVWGLALPRHSHAGSVADAGLYIILGYFVSAFALFFGGWAQLSRKQTHPGLVNLLLAGLALMIALWLLPTFCFA